MAFKIFIYFLATSFDSFRPNGVCVFKRVVPKGLDHTLGVITVSLYVRGCFHSWGSLHADLACQFEPDEFGSSPQ